MGAVKKFFNILLSFPLITSCVCVAATCLMVFWIPDVMAFVFVILAAAFLLVILSRRAYLVSQNVKLRLIIFAVLFISGCWIYWCVSIDDISIGEDKRIKGLSSVNRVFATFFPSRGGFETVQVVENNVNVAPKNMEVGVGKVNNCASNLIEIVTERVNNSVLNNSGIANCESKMDVNSQHQKMRFLYYAWHLCVVCFVSMLVFSVFLGL